MDIKYDYVIIGGGIVGLSVGYETLKKYPGARVLVTEKEKETGTHASGRNSGVLHAGFYYSPDSLKAKFCLEGNFELRELISSDSIPINECGKVVVTQSEEDLPRLENLFKRGLQNGAKLELLSARELPKFEPLAKTIHSFIWSPLTAVSNPSLITDAIRKRFLALGGEIVTNTISKITSDGVLLLNGVPTESKKIVNAGGANAIHLAHEAGIGKEYSQLPVLGIYKITTHNQLPLTRLVYPVPNPENPFLGVHFTLTVDGDVKIGPTAIPILGREQYELKNIPDFKDFASSSKSLLSMFSKSPKNLIKLAVTELPKISTRQLIKSGKVLVPSIDSKITWKPKKPGIRAQLVNEKTGQFEMDYVVRAHHN